MDALEHSSELVRQFEAFYRHVLDLKRSAIDGERLPETPEAESDAETRGPVAVRQRLLTLLERQASSTRRPSGDLAAGAHIEARYAMAALADEIFLNLDWGGREVWGSHLLEAKLFKSHRAGEVIFERIDALLMSNDPSRSDLAQVYLMTLGLGFQGRHRGRPGGETELLGYRRRLFNFLTRRDPVLLQAGRRLFPQAYANTLDQASQERLPYLRPWLLALGLVLLVWVAASFPLWSWLTEDLERLLARFSG